VKVGNGSIKGTVHRDGLPVSATVYLSQNDSANGLQRHVESQANGQYVFDNVLPGTYQIAASIESGKVSQSKSITLEENDDATLDFNIAEASIKVTALDENNNPVPGAQVYYRGAISSGNTITDDNGIVQLDNVSAGSKVNVWVTSSDPVMYSDTRDVEVPEQGGQLTETFILHAYDGEMDCQVLSDEDGLPLSGWVRLQSMSNGEKKVSAVASDQNGDVHITGIPPGDYTMICGSTGFFKDYKTVHIERGSRLDFTERLKVVGSVLTVRLHGPNGKAIANATCVLNSSEGGAPLTAIPVSGGAVISDFLFSDVPKGQWQLQVSAPGFEPVSLPYQASGNSEQLSPVMAPVREIP
jgi:uncharacterized surface anchored protein